MKSQTLTLRQYEAMRLVYIKNEAQSDTAKIMGVSVRCVQTHLYTARKKLGTKNRKEVVRRLNQLP